MPSTIPFTLVLFVAPATPDAREVTRIETTTFDDSAEVLVYDDTGEVSAVLVLQAEPNGRVRLDLDFADGSICRALPAKMASPSSSQRTLPRSQVA